MMLGLEAWPRPPGVAKIGGLGLGMGLVIRGLGLGLVMHGLGFVMFGFGLVMFGLGLVHLASLSRPRPKTSILV